MSNACTASGSGAANCDSNATCSHPGGFLFLGACTCNAGYAGDGTQAGTGCTPIDQCKKADASDHNPCNNNGDTVATCATATPYSLQTYNCDCKPATPEGTGYVSNSVSCVLSCNPGVSEPCGHGGKCVKGSVANTWTCKNCDTGYSPTTGTQQACADTDGCSGITACQTGEAGNTCSDVPASGVGYTCTCGNIAYVVGGTAPAPRCDDKDECETNHCVLSGDTGAACIDGQAPATGYDCTCSSAGWKKATVGAFLECVDVNECAAAQNPCQHGACTNITGGLGYSCVCDSGYVLGGTATNPVCLVDYCNATALTACNAVQPGNSCVNLIPPQSGYVCDCLNPAYISAPGDQFCLNKNDCGSKTANNCTLAGDSNAACNDAPAPKTGYGCDCGSGFEYNGTTCVDLDECASGQPCGAGNCNNTVGSYTCSCFGGALSLGSPPTCVGGAHPYNKVTYTTTKGSFCSAAATAPDASTAMTLLLLAGALIAARRRWLTKS